MTTNPLEIIETGIAKNDMELVRSGFKLLTGKTIDPVKAKSSGRPKKVLEQPTKTTIYGKTMEFVTDPKEKKDNKKLYSNVQEKNRRPQAEKVSAKCRRCDRTEMVYPKLVPSFICSKCQE